MPEQMLAYGIVALLGAMIVHFLCELLLAWASAALVDANPTLLRLCLFVVLTIALTAGSYYVAYLPIEMWTRDWIKTAAAEGKAPWSVYALLQGVFMLCSLLVVAGLAWPVLGTSPKQSLLIGLFVVLLRLLLWSLIFGVIFVILGYTQGFRGTTPKATEKSARVVVAAPARA